MPRKQHASRERLEPMVALCSWRASALRLTGSALMLAALYFVGQRLWSQREALVLWEPTWLLTGALLLAGILQGSAGFLLSGSWARLLRWCTRREPDWRACHGIYGRTQLAKYIPGNVFHFVARHLSGRLEAYTHRDLICALATENVLLVMGAGLTSLSAVYAMAPLLNSSAGGLAWTAVVGCLLGGLLLAWYLLLRVRSRLASCNSLVSVVWRRLLGELSPILIRYLVFFHFTGLLLVGLVCLLHEWPGFLQAEFLVRAAALSWLAGYVIPGAPAGIGVGEAVLLMFLSPAVGESVGLLTTLWLRLISVSGDLWFFVFASCLTRRRKTLGTTVDGSQC